MKNPAEIFFAQLVDGYQQAVIHSGSAVQCHYQMGGKRVQIGYASQENAQVFAPTLQHLGCAALPTACQAPDFTILVWDCVSTGAPMVRAPWSLADYLPNRLVRGYCDERFRTLIYPDAAACLMLDQQACTGIYWRWNIQETPDHERAAPFRELFCWWMSTQGRYFVHGGAIDGVFLAGVGGVGKSTTALACLAQGMAWVGEDYVLLGAEAAPQAYSLYCTAKLGPFSLQLLPEFQADVVIPPSAQSAKSILNLYPRYAEQLRSQVKLRAVVLPHIGGQAETRLIPVTAGQIFRPLFSSTLLQIPGTDPALIRGIANVLRQLPCYVMEIGRDLNQVVACLRTLSESEETLER